MQRLLEAKADVNAADSANREATPLLLACHEGHLAVTKLLLAAGADVDKADGNGSTALHQACGYGHLNMAKLLLEHGADKTKTTNGGHTPLDLARQQGHEEIVKLLLAKPSPKRSGDPLIGKTVVIVGTSREELNGQHALVESFDKAKGRYGCLVGGQTVGLKCENFQVVDHDPPQDTAMPPLT